MQLFRSQLSRFSPHPHRDSWMRNHLKQWLRILQWTAFLTLASAAWLTYKQGSPIGDLYPLKDVLTQSLYFTPTIAQHFLIVLSVFLFLASLCSFRCSVKYKPKYSIPVLIASCILLITAFLYAYNDASGFSFRKLFTFILPASAPYLLTRYQLWQNQVDHWCIAASLLINATIISLSIQTLSNAVGIPNASGTPLIMNQLSPQLNNIIVTSTAYTGIIASISLFYTKLRRVSLYLIIILTITLSAATTVFYLTPFSLSQFFSITMPMTTLLVSYWLIPILILQSLASRKKSRTLRI